jgi:hypothetical protein
MRFSKTPPPRKKKRYPNQVTDDPAFAELLKVMRHGGAQAALIFAPGEDKKLKIAHPWRVAADALRRLINSERLPYRVTKYATDDGGRAVRVIRITAAEEGPNAETTAPARSA